MRRWIVLLTLLTFSVFACAQAVVTSSGTATMQGAAVTPAPYSPPLVVTPTMTMGTPPLQVGATNATPGTYAGANNAPAPVGAVPPLPQVMPQITTTVPVIHEVGPEIYVGNPANMPLAGPSGPVNAAGQFDMGISDGSAAQMAEGGVGSSGLAEAAASVRRRGNIEAAHVYTNQDIARIEQQYGSGGVTGAAVNAGNTVNNGAITQPANEPAVGANTEATQPAPAVNAEPQRKPSPYVNSPFQPRTPQTQQPQTQPIPHNQASAATPENQEMAQANPPAQPGGEQAEAAGTAQSTPEQAAAAPSGRKQLPKAASVLPLLAMVGVAAAATGIMTRK